ncbi:MAG TPA: hypothetical protein VHE61_21195 [Opitutaceae bacterium]|nr:hypothetical protein [Opitutaceae bacterium]
MPEPHRPISALLAQLLVAFTVEFDMEFERQMNEAGEPGITVSLAAWSNLLRFVAAAGSIPLGELSAQALAAEKRIRQELGWLERWGFVALETGCPAPREGWGSGRGLRTGTVVRLTARGETAARIWPPLFSLIEDRWRRRFGTRRMASFRAALCRVVADLPLELPDALPLPAGGESHDLESYPLATSVRPEQLSLAALLSRILLAFAIEYDRTAQVPIALAANVLRILGPEPVPVREIAARSGLSPEASVIGWRLRPYVVVEKATTGRRERVARLSPAGLLAQHEYARLTREVEERWGRRIGVVPVRAVRSALESLFAARRGTCAKLAEGFIPPIGTVRAGYERPALARRRIAPAGRQRSRDLAVQTQAFIGNPAGTLPHFPVWDPNRGFGP